MEFKFKKKDIDFKVDFENSFEEFRGILLHTIKITSLVADDEELINDKTKNLISLKYKYFDKVKKDVLCLDCSGILAKKLCKLLNAKVTSILYLVIDLDDIKEFYDKSIAEAKIKKEQLREKKHLEIVENDKKITDKSIIHVNYNTTYRYNVSIKNHEVSLIAENIEKKLNDNYRAIQSSVFNSCKCKEDFGDYSTNYKYTMSYKELKDILILIDEQISNYNKEKLLKKDEEEKRIKDLIIKAKETGKLQIVDNWHEPCNDRNESCDVDICTKYVDENGKFSIIRNHTW